MSERTISYSSLITVFMQKGIHRIEELIHHLEGVADPNARAAATELVRSVMELHGAGLERMMEIAAQAGETGLNIIDDFGRDELVGSLLLLYGLHPIALETRVRGALDKVRPYLSSHGGNVELLGVDEGVVRLQMQGSCSGCPSSAMTPKSAIEEAIYEAAPDVVEIVAVEEPKEQPSLSVSGFVSIQSLRSKDATRS